jgi:hypothetical protein
MIRNKTSNKETSTKLFVYAVTLLLHHDDRPFILIAVKGESNREICKIRGINCLSASHDKMFQRLNKIYLKDTSFPDVSKTSIDYVINGLIPSLPMTLTLSKCQYMLLRLFVFCKINCSFFFWSFHLYI